MRFSLPIIALFAANALAIDISGAPQCAQTCLINNQGQSTCDPNAVEATCFCADKAFYNVIQSCVLSGCQFSDVLKTLTWYNGICPSSRKARTLRV
ncbi:hypothetical protein DM02DRAFT_652008 [Periconia macrospinosa]|uniref:CFEM domain-containing protein n=1 Tax=Periconia macrospinosa TaxID=97972 RepID=A0A2V1E0E6_9PLEO|nr:hypothetical protein DM02DRAFT_652008 [Periconia macrospinosa]